MKYTTLCYIEKDGKYLMLFRNKKSNDENEGRYIGIGGKLEKNETVYECVCREVKEETGLVLASPELCGIIEFRSDIYETEIMYLFHADDFSGRMIECDEGTLSWVKKDKIMSLSLWEGDRLFLRELISGKRDISMTLIYKGDKLVSHSGCTLCPKLCGTDRFEKPGACGEKMQPRISRASLHMWEEPCISGDSGSGTVFFSGCPLHCVYCQNEHISHGGAGTLTDAETLSDVYLKLQSMGAANINLVTPTHFALPIARSLAISKKSGLEIPIVFNTSGYERPETLKIFGGLVNIYLTDFKYSDSALSYKYSSVRDYEKTAETALDEMLSQTGSPSYYENGMMKSGVIVRDLLLPGYEKDSEKVIKYLYETYKDDIVISIMNQYTPMENAEKYPEIDRRVTSYEYDKLVNYALDIGVKNAYIQEGGTQSKSFIPDFDDFDLARFLS